MMYSRPVSPIPRGVTMDSVDRPAPQPTPREDPALAELDPKLPDEISARSPLARGWRTFERALDERIKEAAIAA